MAGNSGAEIRRHHNPANLPYNESSPERTLSTYGGRSNFLPEEYSYAGREIHAFLGRSVVEWETPEVVLISQVPGGPGWWSPTASRPLGKQTEELGTEILLAPNNRFMAGIRVGGAISGESAKEQGIVQSVLLSKLADVEAAMIVINAAGSASTCSFQWSPTGQRAPSGQSTSEVAERLIREASVVPHTPDPTDISRQLNELKALTPGWFDGEGESYNPERLDRLAEFFNIYFPNFLERPVFFPMVDGGVMMEWRFGANDISLELNVDSLAAYWHCLNHRTDVSEERDLDLGVETEWVWLVQNIRQYQNETTLK